MKNFNLPFGENFNLPFGHYRGFKTRWFLFTRPHWQTTHDKSGHTLFADSHSELMNKIDAHECPACQHGRQLEWRDY